MVVYAVSMVVLVVLTNGSKNEPFRYQIF